MYPAIQIGDKITIPLYGMVFMTGLFLAVLAARRIGPGLGVAKDDVLYGVIYGAIGILVGAKILYFLTKLPGLIRAAGVIGEKISESPWNTIYFLVTYSFGGFVFYGGLIGALYGVYRYCRRYQVSFMKFMDICAPLIPFVHGVGRIGCFLSGCCYGMEYHGPGSVRFPHNDGIPGLDAVPRMPVQLMETGFNFLLCGILFWLLFKKGIKNGRLLGIYLICYAAARFGLEFLRGDAARGSVGFFSTSQLISLLLIPAGVLLARGYLERRSAKTSERRSAKNT